MGTNIILKRSASPDNIPSIANVELGEVAINTHDGKMFIKKDDTSSGGGASIIEIGKVDTDNFYRDDAHLIPAAADTYDLGSLTNPFRDLYLGPQSLYVNGTQLISDNSNTINIHTDADQHLDLQTSGIGNIGIAATGSGNITIAPAGAGNLTLGGGTGSGNVELRSTVEILAGENVISSDGNAINFSQGANFSGNVEATTMSEDGTQLSAKYAPVHSHPYDNYGSWRLNVNNTFVNSIQANETLNFDNGSGLNVYYTSDTVSYSLNTSINVLNIGTTGVDLDLNIGTNGTGNINLNDDVVTTNSLTVGGDLTVNGLTTIINTDTLQVEDKNIELGKVTTPTDITADGGGITLLGDTNKTILWTDATDSWDFNQSVNISGNLDVTGEVTGTNLIYDNVANQSILPAGSNTFTVGTSSPTSADAEIIISGARTSAANSDITKLSFENDTSVPYTFAQIAAQDPNGDHSLGDGQLIFRTSDGGVLSDQFRIDQNGDSFANNDLTVGGDLTAGSFIGDLTGNADTSTDAPKFIKGTGTVAGTWLGAHADIDSYYDGLIISYLTPVAGGSATTLNINGLGAVDCYIRNTTRLTTHYIQNSLVIFVYSSTLNGGSFIAHSYYSSTESYTARWHNDSVKAGENCYGYELLMEGIDGQFYPVTTGTEINTTTRPVSTAEMRMGGQLLQYLSGNDIVAGGSLDNLFESVQCSTMEYWGNRTTANWGVLREPIYLVGEENGNGNFVLDNTTTTSFLTQDLPTTADGKIYVLIGWMTTANDDYRKSTHNPFLEYRDGAIRPYNKQMTKDEIIDLNFVTTDTAQTITGAKNALLDNNDGTVTGSFKFGRNSTQYMRLHGSSGGNKLTSMSPDSNAKPFVLSVRTESTERQLILPHDTNDILYNGLKVWNEGNDGIGSGLNADLLDGMDSNKFILNNQGTAAEQFVDNFNMRKYINFNDYDDTSGANTGLRTYVRDGEWFIGADTSETNPVKMTLSGDSSLFTARQFESTVPTGNAPLTVASTTKVTNLNADLLDGNDTSYYVNTSVAQSIGGIKTFTDTTDSTSDSTGAVIVDGGIGVKKKLYVSDNIISTGDFITTTGRLMWENGKHSISNNDGNNITFNFGCDGDTDLSTENGYASTWVNSQATGIWAFKVSTASLTAGAAATSWTSILDFGPTEINLKNDTNITGSLDVSVDAVIDGTLTVGGTEVASRATDYDFDVTVANTKIFTCAYNINDVQVFVSGIKLRANQYTATNGTTVELTYGVDIGTWVQVVSR